MAEIPEDGLRPPPGVEPLERPVGWFWMLPDGIVRVRMRPGRHLRLVDAKEILAAYAELGGGEPVRVLADIVGVPMADREHRQHMGREGAPYHVAVAFIVRNPVVRLFTNAFTSLARPSYPVRPFAAGAEDAAIAWLLEQGTR